MEYRRLGRTGISVSPLGMGTDTFADPTSEAECIKMFKSAVDAGINVFDTGDAYAEGKGEKILGKAIKETCSRDAVIIATKCDSGQRRPGLSLDDFIPELGPNHNGASRLNIIRACEQSLKRMGTDYIDIYMMHRMDPNVAIEETLSALTDLVRQGKIRYIGCSTHPAWAVANSIMMSELKGYARYICEESPYNLLDRRIENELIPCAQHFDMGMFCWSPLAMGVLAGRYTNTSDYPSGSRAALRGGYYADRITKKGIEIGVKFCELAKEVGISAAQLAILWCKDQPGITAPLIGPRTYEQLQTLLPVLNMKLSDEVREACDALVPPGSAVANFHNTADWMKTQLI
ncbi:MAG TPA: aldo/keto reductase [Tissierellaceae bacterium]|nr:aldo/keto reductase [Tissierellaceae bacterium]